MPKPAEQTGFTKLQDTLLTETSAECVHLVIVPHTAGKGRGLPGDRDVLWPCAYLDEETAKVMARALKGVVAAVPIVHDYRSKV